VYLKHLSLTNFRNYRSLKLEFPRPLTLLQGPNAQGKTNLLEAIFFLATSRSSQARADRQLINWAVEDEPLPFARLVAELDRDGRTNRLELTLAPTDTANGQLRYQKQIRINGVPRRAFDLVGEMKVVLFVPQDIDLVAGSPSGRRRYLDVALCQIDREYCRRLSRYNQLLPRRNRILRQLGERGGDREQLAFWEEQLAEHAGLIMARRQRAVDFLAACTRERHAALTGGSEELDLSYLPSFTANAQGNGPMDASALGAAYLVRLRETRAREVAAGMTLIGPHRDDLGFAIAGHSLGDFGSRGQQRTASMALKLAEMEYMIVETGEQPILLLDDVMSELDGRRRRYLSGLLTRVQQAVITTTDLEDYTPAFLEQVTLWHAAAGDLLSHEEYARSTSDHGE
jgi:DNA replication and repair protein RecF